MLKNINFGIKISLEKFNLLSDIYKYHELIDFIEIILPPFISNENIIEIQNLNMPYAIHLPTSKVGFDLGENKNKEKNNKILERIKAKRQILNKLYPICYIVHPESGDINYSILNIKKIDIKPLAIENMPLRGIYGYDLIGYDIATLALFFEKISDLEFCLDINHAIKAAISLNKDYLSFIENFLKFKKPILFHISGGNLDQEIDEHLNLYEGEYDIPRLKHMLLNYGEIVNLTFETPKNYEFGIQDDLENMRFFFNV